MLSFRASGGRSGARVLFPCGVDGSGFTLLLLGYRGGYIGIGECIRALCSSGGLLAWLFNCGCGSSGSGSGGGGSGGAALLLVRQRGLVLDLWATARADVRRGLQNLLRRLGVACHVVDYCDGGAVSNKSLVALATLSDDVRELVVDDADTTTVALADRWASAGSGRYLLRVLHPNETNASNFGLAVLGQHHVVKVRDLPT
jgi:hypothetical protein